MAKRYDKKIQSLCKTPVFGLIKNSESSLGIVEQYSFNDIVEAGHKNAPLLSRIIKLIKVISQKPLLSMLVNMKMVAILTILCQSSLQNNSN